MIDNKATAEEIIGYAKKLRADYQFAKKRKPKVIGDFMNNAINQKFLNKFLDVVKDSKYSEVFDMKFIYYFCTMFRGINIEFDFLYQFYRHGEQDFIDATYKVSSREYNGVDGLYITNILNRENMGEFVDRFNISSFSYSIYPSIDTNEINIYCSSDYSYNPNLMRRTGNRFIVEHLDRFSKSIDPFHKGDLRYLGIHADILYRLVMTLLALYITGAEEVVSDDRTYQDINQG